MQKLNIGFVWQGVSEPLVREHWKDGLYVAMKEVEKYHNVSYLEPWDNFDGLDLLLYWEAPVSFCGGNSSHYQRVKNYPIKKVLLFAGGQIRPEWIEGFDHICVESQINCAELCELGFPHSTAFGINDVMFKPLPLPKSWDGIHHGTFADWKRQRLVGEALKDKAVLAGRRQDSDTHDYNECVRFGAYIVPEQTYEEVNKLINLSHTMVQTANMWGGGQRATLEAMACGVPVICMSDSPKNREYVEESGFGLVVEPTVQAIRDAVSHIKNNPNDFPSSRGIDYVKSKWTSKHYADSILKTLQLI
jgi:glycosyltransferase involved in cell wall biosynthesis